MKIPKIDTRKYYSDSLENNIKYTIIQDKHIETTSVCVCIKAGSINNPKEYQGLAHFLEHMLFLGSKKYPQENYFDETIMPLIKNKELLSFGNKYVLIEFGFHSEPQFLDQLFFELKTAGYNPVIAHFERYMYYFGKIDIAKKWRQKGINIQLNLNSAIGQYGPAVKKQAEALIDSGQIDFVGTDCHCIEHLMVLEENIDLHYLRKVGQLLLKNTVL